MKQKWISFGRVAAASVVMAALASPMRATVVQTYSDRGLWAASLTTVTTADFDEDLTGPNAVSGYQVYNNAAGYETGIFQFLAVTTEGTNQGFNLVRQNIGAGENWLRGPAFSGTDPRLVINFASAATAFGIDISSGIPGLSFQITVTDGEGPQLVSTTGGFFGVRSSSNISQVTIRQATAGDTEVHFDNAAWGTFVADPGGGGDDPGDPSETPETSTILYGATGLLLLAWTRYRRPLTR